MLMNALTSPPVLICAFLSSAIPLAVYYINRKLHEAGDPAWKKKSKGKNGSAP
jgi:hypothetical protein